MPISMDAKRSGEEMTVVALKKSRPEEIVSNSNAQLVQSIKRTSNLLAPIMLLTGHGGEIFAGKFHPEGQWFASAGFERRIFFWNVYGECDNFGVLTGHNGAILQLEFNADGSNLFSASTDKTVGLWDTKTGHRIKRLKGHTNFVNSCHPARRGPPLVCTGSDDGYIKVWDCRRKGSVASLQNVYQVTAVTFNDTAEQVFSGGIDNDIKVWDLRKGEILYRLHGHTETLTGLSLSPDGSYLLSNAMDGCLRIWDIRPYVPAERCVKIFMGHSHNFEKNLLRCSWSFDGSKIAAGSADRCVYIWDTTNRRILYKLPGHNGSVNEVVFHPLEPIVMSVSSDKQIYIGEIE